jgi:uncharacterized protein YkwD
MRCCQLTSTTFVPAIAALAGLLLIESLALTATAADRPLGKRPTGTYLTADQQAILDAHNQYRAKHCVPAMEWSPGLAALAGQWARGCRSEVNGDTVAFQHFKGGGVKTGENLYWSWPSGNAPGSAAVDSWYNEIGSYDFNNPVYSQATGHFTQMIWRASTQLGCAKAVCEKDHQYDYWVCRYYSPGNVDGQFAANVPQACK